MAKVMKQRKAPIHKSMAKPLNSCLQNFTHSGVVGGGVRALGPSRSKISLAFSCVRPFREHYYKTFVTANACVIFKTWQCIWVCMLCLIHNSSTYFNLLTPKIWLLILLSSSYTFTCKLVWELGIRSRWQLLSDQFEHTHYLFAGWHVDIRWEKLHVNHFWGWSG